MKETVSGMMLILLLVSILAMVFNIRPVNSTPKTIVVPDDYRTIRQAIYVANPGDTIYVRAGIYYENYIDITKSLQLVGENRKNTIIDGGGKGDVVRVLYTSNAVIKEFTIQNSSSWSWGGIQVYNSSNVAIQNNNVINNTIGINVSFSDNCTIVENNITNNSPKITLIKLLTPPFKLHQHKTFSQQKEGMNHTLKPNLKINVYKEGQDQPRDTRLHQQHQTSTKNSTYIRGAKLPREIQQKPIPRF